jgi:hypothetical protein
MTLGNTVTEELLERPEQTSIDRAFYFRELFRLQGEFRQGRSSQTHQPTP